MLLGILLKPSGRNFFAGKKINVRYRTVFIQKIKLMSRNKWIFLVFGIVFLMVILIIGIDMSKKTTFPGSKGNLKERMAPSEQK